MRMRLAALLLLVPALAHGQSVSCNFEVFNNGLFCFESFALPLIPSGRTIELAVGQGYHGGNAAKITVNGCTTNCNAGSNQGNIGWGHTLGGTYQMGDSFFVWMRLKPLTDYGGQALNQKFLIRGDVNSERFMVHLSKPFDTVLGCQPSGEGNDYYGSGGGLPADSDPTNAYIRASDWGFGQTFTTMAGASRRSHYWNLSPRINIGSNCTAQALMPNRAAVPDIKPQWNSDPTEDGWTTIIIQATSGECGASDLRMWLNTGNQSQPSAQAINMNIVGGLCRMGVSGWAGQMSIGGFWGMNDTQAVSFLIDDFGVGPNFPTGLYQGPSTPATAPLMPVRVALPGV